MANKGQTSDSQQQGQSDRSKKSSKDYKQSKKNGKSSWITFSLNIGFFAGFFWGFVAVFQHYFHFTHIVPGFLLVPFFPIDFLRTGYGYLVGWLSWIPFSMIASLLYGLLFRRRVSHYRGLIYGALCWGLLFVLICPMLNMTLSINLLDWNSIITSFCLFLVWGLFIGYSISMEYTDEGAHEPAKSTFGTKKVSQKNS